MKCKDQAKKGACAVCEEPSTGLHYGAMTCEGCKGFFKRNHRQHSTGALSLCLRPTPSMNRSNRNWCKHCRMQKCISVGMSLAGIVKGRPKNMKTKVQKLVDTGLVTVSGSSKSASSSGYSSASSNSNSPDPATDSECSISSQVVPLDQLIASMDYSVPWPSPQVNQPLAGNAFTNDYNQYEPSAPRPSHQAIPVQATWDPMLLNSNSFTNEQHGYGASQTLPQPVTTNWDPLSLLECSNTVSEEELRCGQAFLVELEEFLPKHNALETFPCSAVSSSAVPEPTFCLGGASGDVEDLPELDFSEVASFFCGFQTDSATHYHSS